MDETTLLAILGICGTLVAAIIGAVAGLRGLKEQDEGHARREEERIQAQNRRRREVAYRRLAAIVEAVLSADYQVAGDPAKKLTEQNYDTINSIITESGDVLDHSTIETWDTRQPMARFADGAGRPFVRVLCAAFWPNVMKYYNEYKANAVSPE